MKILIVSTQVFPSPPPGYGGLEQVVFDLAEELGKLDQEVYLVAPEGSGGEHFKVITPCKPDRSNPEHLAYESIKPILRDFDVIHDHSWSGYPYLAQKEWPRLPLLHTIHSPNPYTSNPVEKPCWICPSDWHSQHTKQLLGSDPRTVYHGIDLEKHTPTTEAKGDYLLFMARTASFKGPIEFIQLCKDTGMRGMLAAEDWYIDDWGFVRTVMEACTDTQGQVSYLGRVGQDYKVELMQFAQCLVTPLQPPYYEVFGLATVEAMACGTPVLSTDRGAARELIEHGISGAIAEDSSCLGHNLKIALDCKPDACRSQAEKFDRSKMALDYLKVYEDVANGIRW